MPALHCFRRTSQRPLCVWTDWLRTDVFLFLMFEQHVIPSEDTPFCLMLYNGLWLNHAQQKVVGISLVNNLSWRGYGGANANFRGNSKFHSMRVIFNLYRSGFSSKIYVKVKNFPAATHSADRMLPVLCFLCACLCDIQCLVCQCGQWFCLKYHPITDLTEEYFDLGGTVSK